MKPLLFSLLLLCCFLEQNALALTESLVCHSSRRHKNTLWITTTLALPSNSWLDQLSSSSSAEDDRAEEHGPSAATDAPKSNRFSKFAPSQDLEADDFRAQLKENMKKDLERRRQQDPNRGNQPAKKYLDSLK